MHQWMRLTFGHASPPALFSAVRSPLCHRRLDLSALASEILLNSLLSRMIGTDDSLYPLPDIIFVFIGILHQPVQLIEE